MIHGSSFQMNIGIQFFVAVILLDDDDENVCILSRAHLFLDKNRVYMSNVCGAGLHKFVETNKMLPADNPLRPIKKFAHNIECNLVL